MPLGIVNRQASYPFGTLDSRNTLGLTAWIIDSTHSNGKEHKKKINFKS